MPTAKKRINITMEDDAYEALERLAALRNKSVSGVSLTLIQHALELEEDLYFSKMSDERIKSKEKRISHSKAWR